MEEYKNKIRHLILDRSEEIHSEFEGFEDGEEDEGNGSVELFIESDTAIAIAMSVIDEIPMPVKDPVHIVPAWFAEWISKNNDISKGELVFYLSWLIDHKEQRLTVEQQNWVIGNREFAIRAILDNHVAKKEN